MDDGRKQIMVTSGPYTFQIIDNTLFSRDKTEIYSRNFKIGGTYPDCVNISVIYENNKPIDACMPILLSDSECSFVRPLEKGGGAITMIKTLLDYVHTQLPSLTYIKFDDKSSIECATEEELKKGSRFRKKGTYVRPIPLYYFSILFNGKTWYEKYFNATQKDKVRHQQYRKRIDEFLYSSEFKTKISFDRFVTLFDKREEEMIELQQYYHSANNFSDFFQSIPKHERCRLVGPWIDQFMKYILKDVFYNEDWMIQLPFEISGGNNKIRNKNKKTRKYYCPKGIITNNFQAKNICLFPEDIE
jgi:hypothetical protein